MRIKSTISMSLAPRKIHMNDAILTALTSHEAYLLPIRSHRYIYMKFIFVQKHLSGSEQNKPEMYCAHQH